MLSEKEIYLLLNIIHMNPVTRKIVSECAYDKDAILLKKSNLVNLLKSNDFKDFNTGYCLFFPEFLKFLDH